MGGGQSYELETHTLLQIYIEISLRNLLPSHYAFFIHMVFEVKLDLH